MYDTTARVFSIMFLTGYDMDDMAPNEVLLLLQLFLDFNAPVAAAAGRGCRRGGGPRRWPWSTARRSRRGACNARVRARPGELDRVEAEVDAKCS
ncbi:1-alkyl-2-acetylglycerophosphocholine esterase [Aureococcus anophagefferens]|nr:1-alkyl-2-acetylglycerophosphocholine esterase [Aureococcus anophagefferens]